MIIKKHNLFMQKGAYALFCIFVFSFVNSQVNVNLVNNFSAEQFTTCPSNLGQAYNATYWYLPTGYNGSSDYFNPCSSVTIVQVPTNYGGTQIPNTGSSYFGIITYKAHQVPWIDYREYLGNGLKQQLKVNKLYCVSYNVSLAELSRYASANIGVVFSKDSILNRNPPFPAQPLILTPNLENLNIITDTISWIQIQGTYLSVGIERFITIGNFRTDVNTLNTQVKPLDLSSNPQNYAYYYIDDVSVVEINPANAAPKDTLFSRCVSDSVLLGTDSTEFATYTWQSTAAGLAALSCTNCPNPIAKPQITTKYYLTKVQCSATTKDSVTVVVLTPTTQANAGNDANICPNEIVSLGVQDSTAFVNYNWQFIGNSSLSCTNCATPIANVQQTTEFVLQRTECNVTSSDTVKVTVDFCDIVIPNVFTPNADGINDVWKFKLPTGAKLNELTIYDRWGLLMYALNSDQLPLKSETTTLNLQWDGYTTAGIACSDGVYFYTLTYTDKKGEAKNMKGYVSLFR